MSEKRNVSYTNGTAALKIPRQDYRPREAKIIAFPSSRTVANTAKAAPASRPASDDRAKVPSPRRPQHAATPDHRRSVRETLRGIILASEMYCSLRYESMLGCPYHLFSREGVALLSAGAALIGIVSLILGS